jgi:transposase
MDASPPGPGCAGSKLVALDAISAQIAVLDRRLEQIAATAPSCEQVRQLTSFAAPRRSARSACSPEIGGFRRFAVARELMSFLALTVRELSSVERRRRGSTTKVAMPTFAGCSSRPPATGTCAASRRESGRATASPLSASFAACRLPGVGSDLLVRWLDHPSAASEMP